MSKLRLTSGMSQLPLRLGVFLQYLLVKDNDIFITVKTIYRLMELIVNSAQTKLAYISSGQSR